jgi:hypothetical protein
VILQGGLRAQGADGGGFLLVVVGVIDEVEATLGESIFSSLLPVPGTIVRKRNGPRHMCPPSNAALGRPVAGSSNDTELGSSAPVIVPPPGGSVTKSLGTLDGSGFVGYFNKQPFVQIIDCEGTSP